MVENGDIDIMFGIPLKTQSHFDIIFNKYSFNKEKFALFGKEEVSFHSLSDYEELRIGLVEEDINAEWILEFFNAISIKASITYAGNYNELEELLNKDKIDLIIENAYKKTSYKKIYEFIGDEIYIVGNKNSEKILKQIDNTIEEIKLSKTGELTRLYNKYFKETNKKLIVQGILIFIVSIILIMGIIIYFLIPIHKRFKIKSKIRARINKNRYILQYQPIHNPRNGEIIAFEALLRLLDDDNKLIPPYKFIPEIEKNNMLFEISIWILKKVASDYKIIKDNQCMKDKEFYISINVSLHEICNDKFLKEATEILRSSNLGSNKICLEIIERVRISNSKKILEHIKILREVGFKIAIDDFGVEYSNLDVLQKLDVDIVKVDKSFVDGIGKNIIKSEIINFVSKITQSENKAMVLEGVEELEQDIEIKKIENDKLYVQGYYYNKPMHIKDICDL